MTIKHVEQNVLFPKSAKSYDPKLKNMLVHRASFANLIIICTSYKFLRLNVTKKTNENIFIMMLCVQCNLCWFHYLFYSCMKRRTADNNKPFLVYFCTISMLHNICYLLPGIFFIMPKDVEIALFTINPEHFMGETTLANNWDHIQIPYG